MSWTKFAVRSIAAAVVVASATLGTADVPSTFPATYTGRQRIVVTFTYFGSASPITLTRGEANDGSVVFDDASNLHFTPDYPGGTANATWTQSDDNKVQFTYDPTTVGVLHDYYLSRFVDKGVLRPTDEFEVQFKDGKFVFRDGLAKLRGRQPLRFKARRNGHLILRGFGALTWRGSQG